MTQIKKKYLTISKGQISPKLIERTDIDLLDKSGQEITNFSNSNFGSLKVMEGTYSSESLIHEGILSVTDPTTVKTFSIKINGNQYWLGFMENYINIFNLQGYISSVNISGLNPKTQNITVAQYNDLILVTNGLNPIWKIDYNESTQTLSYSVYTINEKYIPKQSPVQEYTTQSPASNLIAITLTTIKKQIFDIQNLRIQQTDGLANTGSKATLSVHYVNTNLQVDDFLNCTIYTQGTTTTTLRNKIQAIFAGQVIKANNNTQVFLIEGIGYEVNSGSIKIKSLTGRFLVGADNIDSSTGKMQSTDDWTLEVSPPLFSGGTINTQQSPWNVANYPNTITFFQNRLVIGGSQLNGAQVVFSKTSDYNDFSDTDGLNTDGFQLIIGSDKQEIIQHLIVRQGLQIFCKESEWQLDNSVVSRTNGFIRNSDIGSTRTKPIISPTGSTLFVDKNGKNLVEYQYNYQTNSYEIPYLNILTDIIGDAKLNHLYLNKTSQGNYIYACLDNGDLIVMNYMQSHNIESFTRYHFDNVKFIATTFIEATGDLMFIVENTTNYKVSFIRTKYAESLKISALGLLSTFTKTDNVITFNYRNIIAGSDSINLYDNEGNYINTYATDNDSAIRITLSEEDAEKNITYLGMNIKSKFVSNPLNYGMTTFDKYKNISQLKIVVSEDSNPEFLTVNGKNGRKKDNFITFYRVARPSRKCQFTVENNIYPCEILSMEVDLEI